MAPTHHSKQSRQILISLILFSLIFNQLYPFSQFLQMVEKIDQFLYRTG